VKNFPHVSFSILTDSLSGANSINSLSKIENKNHKVFIDIDCGMHRTGIEVEEVYELFLFLKDCENIDFSGLHVYDGHVHDHSEKLRFSKSEEIVNSIRRLEKVLLQDQNSFDIIIGGSPTFPMYASLTSYDLSPGTTVLWDFGYGEAYPEMGFDIAAVLAGRVVSKPSKNQVCIDLGYKAMASEMNHPRIKFHGINDYIVKNQSEEHLVIEANECINIEIGHLLYGIPRHICPTVALYDTYSVIENNKVITTWPIEGRKRKITY
ncbi:MAG: alanine racemase, partial [Cyclobacteriaceae bacterium]|nr:alanine racemase [Cyclobacteriaceae bacterium]